MGAIETMMIDCANASAARSGLSGRAQFRVSDYRDCSVPEGAFGLVVSNPPYIPPDALPVDPEVREYDPPRALYGGGDDGLDVVRAVVARAERLLRDGGFQALFLTFEPIVVIKGDPAPQRGIGFQGGVKIRRGFPPLIVVVGRCGFGQPIAASKQGGQLARRRKTGLHPAAHFFQLPLPLGSFKQKFAPEF